MDRDDVLRKHLQKMLDWEDAHAGFEKAVQGIPENLRGVKPAGLPYTAWQLLEHLRICQWDILEFCVNPNYKELPFEEYWPKTVAPPTANSWKDSIDAFERDRKALQELAADKTLDLHAAIPHGTGQTYLRELLLVADHNAYHIADIVAVRRILGIW